ncbi:MAG: ATP-grasp domain-containing protein [bacterium]|nr:ATP-grasp domain-containing protein [bacterium]
MLYCFDSRLPFDYSKLEMELSKLNGNGILYDNELKKITDFMGNKIDITGKLIFPRTGATQIYEMNTEIIKYGGIPVVTNEQIDMIEEWPKYYDTDRKMKILKGRELIDLNVILELESIYGKEIFLKTKSKNFNSVISIELLRDTECAFYKALSYHLDEEFIVSEKVDIIEDEYGKKEYRCFIVDNQVYNISRFTVDVLHRIDNRVLEKAQEIVKLLKDKISEYYVLDLFEYKNANSITTDVLELNPIHSSGLYLYNSAMEKSDDILHSNLRKVSREFMNKVNECSIDGYMINNRNSLYHVPHSFAGDLRSICLIGDISLKFTHYTSLSVTDFARHKPINDFSSMTPITDDDMLSGLVSEGFSQDKMDSFQKLLKFNQNNERKDIF